MSPRLRELFDHDVPLEVFLEDWNEMVIRGFTSLKQLSADQYGEVAFEDLIERPEGECWARSSTSSSLPSDADLDGSRGLAPDTPGKAGQRDAHRRAASARLSSIATRPWCSSSASLSDPSSQAGAKGVRV